MLNARTHSVHLCVYTSVCTPLKRTEQMAKSYTGIYHAFTY